MPVSDEVSHGALGAGIGAIVGGPIGGLIGLIGGVIVAKLLADQGVPATPQNVSRAQEALAQSPDLVQSLMSKIGVENDNNWDFGMSGVQESGELNIQDAPVFSEGRKAASENAVSRNAVDENVVSHGTANRNAVSRSTANRNVVSHGAVSGNAISRGTASRNAVADNVGIAENVPTTNITPEEVLAQLLATTGVDTQQDTVPTQQGAVSVQQDEVPIPEPINPLSENQEMTAVALPPPRSGAVKQRVFQTEPYPNKQGRALAPTSGAGLPADDVTISRTPTAADPTALPRRGTMTVPQGGSRDLTVPGSPGSRAVTVSETGGSRAVVPSPDLNTPTPVSRLVEVLQMYYARRNMMKRQARNAARTANRRAGTWNRRAERKANGE